jgi:uncharacterized RDD family membrane protein YckC
MPAGSPADPDAGSAEAAPGPGPEPEPEPGPTMPDARPVHYVGFWARALAGCIDLLAGAVVIALVAQLVDPHHRTAREKGLMQFTLEYVLPAVAILAFWFTRGATPGKMVISAVIVDEKTLAMPTRRQLVLRYFGYYVSTIVLCLGYVWIAFDARKQAWHDKIAGTVVVRNPKRWSPHGR